MRSGRLSTTRRTTVGLLGKNCTILGQHGARADSPVITHAAENNRATVLAKSSDVLLHHIVNAGLVTARYRLVTELYRPVFGNQEPFIHRHHQHLTGLDRLTLSGRHHLQPGNPLHLLCQQRHKGRANVLRINKT